MIRTTDNTADIFVSDPPDWSEGVEVEFAYETGVFVSRSTLEQRIRHRENAKINISWARSGLTKEVATAAVKTGYAEAFAANIVPIWTEPGKLVAPSGLTLALDIAIPSGLFRVGDYVHIAADGFASRFEKITAVNHADSILTLFIPVAGYPVGTTVTPCRRCQKRVSNSDLEASGENSYKHRRQFVTL